MHHGCRVVVAAIATLAATLAVAQSAAGAIVASPSSLTFPDTAVGAESTLAVTFTNTDPTASYLSVFSTSPVGGDFTLGSTDCPFPLPGGATCQYTIRFTPSSVGMKSGTFSWATTNGESEGSVALSGVGVMPPIVSFGPAPAFPDQRIDEPGPVRTVTVTNTGDQDLVVSSVGLIGADASAFELVSQDCTAAPAPASGSCEMSLRFAPATAGAKSASLRLVSNALASPSDLALSATGLTPPQVSFGPAPSFPIRSSAGSGPIGRSR
jgi:hypothetical protein